MKVGKYAELKKQDWYDHDWAMTPVLWDNLKRCYDMEKCIKEIHEMFMGPLDASIAWSEDGK